MEIILTIPFVQAKVEDYQQIYDMHLLAELIVGTKILGQNTYELIDDVGTLNEPEALSMLGPDGVGCFLLEKE